MTVTPGTAAFQSLANASLPTELATFHPFSDAPSYVLPIANVITTTDWNASATYPQAAYWFESWTQHPTTRRLIKLEGQGYVANASVSSTPVPRITNRAGVPGTPAIVTATPETMPAELAAFMPFSSAIGNAKISIAQIAYTADWNPASTTPQVAYYFTAWFQSTATPFGVYKIEGVGWVTNPSVSTTPVVRMWKATFCTGTAAADGGNLLMAMYSHRGVQMAAMGEDLANNGVLALYSSGGVQTVQLDSQGFLDSGHQVVGGQLAIWTANGSGVVQAIAVFPSVSVSS